MKTATVLLFVLMVPNPSFAGIHDDCRQDGSSLNRIFAAGYFSGVLDMLTNEQTNGHRAYVFPAEMTYEQGFDAICRVIDNHPELWNVPSREAIQSAAEILWKESDPSGVPSGIPSGMPPKSPVR